MGTHYHRKTGVNNTQRHNLLPQKDMAKRRDTFYGVHTGRVPGVYNNWDDCQAATKGGKAVFKGFRCARLAHLFHSTGPRMGCRGMDPHFPTLPYFTPNLDDPYRVVLGYLTASYKRWSPEHRQFVVPAPLDEDPVFQWVFTDGSLNKATGRAKAGVFFGSDSDLNLSVAVPAVYAQSNQTAEMYAIYLALRTSRPSVYIFSDSEYAIKWTSGVYKINESTANRDLILAVQEAIAERQEKHGDKNRVMLLKVPAHCGMPGNEHADALAGLKD